MSSKKILIVVVVAVMAIVGYLMTRNTSSSGSSGGGGGGGGGGSGGTCTKDDQCQTSQKCSGGTCVYPPSGLTCYSDSDCGTDGTKKCSNGSCITPGKESWEGSGTNDTFTCTRTGTGNYKTEHDCYQGNCVSLYGGGTQKCCIDGWSFRYDPSDGKYKCIQKREPYSATKNPTPSVLTNRAYCVYSQQHTADGNCTWQTFNSTTPDDQKPCFSGQSWYDPVTGNQLSARVPTGFNRNSYRVVAPHCFIPKACKDSTGCDVGQICAGGFCIDDQITTTS